MSLPNAQPLLALAEALHPALAAGDAFRETDEAWPGLEQLETAVSPEAQCRLPRGTVTRRARELTEPPSAEAFAQLVAPQCPTTVHRLREFSRGEFRHRVVCIDLGNSRGEF